MRRAGALLTDDLLAMASPPPTFEDLRKRILGASAQESLTGIPMLGMDRGSIVRVP
jgi:hypothetical protein